MGFSLDAATGAGKLPPYFTCKFTKMDSMDLRVIGDAVGWLEQGQAVHLVTVVQTWGSSPRPAGSLLAVRQDGTPSGSVSGGCIEEDLIRKILAGTVAPELPERTLYGVTKAEGEKFGLPCGGVLELVVEPIREAADLAEVRDALRERRPLTRQLDVATGKARLVYEARDSLCHLEGNLLERFFGPRWQLIVIGAGDLSRPVAELALSLDFEVVVCDPRPEFADNWRMEGTVLSRKMPDDLIRDQAVDERTAIITLTHDSRIDDMALMEALPSPAFYVGSLGSTRTQARRRERLVALDLPQAAIDRLRAPIGLPIGSHTPMEIAVAVAAELVAVRNKVDEQALAAAARAASQAATS